ncbi:MAG: zinc ribbon domain-containing protein [Candidatus Lokiarchaeota archaeon]|nr:zinc ribbon domain-containing protein [Candidatus Lokiarchaeota archaeon]
MAISNISLKASYTTILLQGESVDIGGYVENNQIQWSFGCLETDIGIELWLLSLGDYINYTSNQPPYGWFILSDGTKHQDSGMEYTSFLNTSIVYLIFTNRGLGSATLTFNINFASIYQEPNINPPFFSLITFLIIIFAIITVSSIIYFFQRYKRDKKQSKKGTIEEKTIAKPLKSIKDINYKNKLFERTQNKKAITQLIEKPTERKEVIENIINSSYCSYCGKKFDKDVKICSQCGSRIKK